MKGRDMRGIVDDGRTRRSIISARLLKLERVPYG